MDRDEYQKTISQKDRNTSWFRYGRDSLQGLTNAASDLRDFPPKPSPTWFYNFTLKIKMDTCQNGKLSSDFSHASIAQRAPGRQNENLLDDHYGRQGKKKELVPIIFLHGLAGSRTSQSGSCRDLASHGYIVFSLDHFDGSAYYAEKKGG
jgi:hypothetical protein